MIFDLETGKPLPTIFGDDMVGSIEWTSTVSRDQHRLLLLRRNLVDIFCARTFNRILRLTFDKAPKSVEHVELLLHTFLEQWQK